MDKTIPKNSLGTQVTVEVMAPIARDETSETRLPMDWETWTWKSSKICARSRSKRIIIPSMYSKNRARAGSMSVE